MKQAASFFSKMDVVYDDAYGCEDYKLFDLPASIMATLQAGDEVCFKGRGEGEVVLCSADATFAVRKVESSNTTLVLPAGEDGAFCAPRVVGSINCHYEITATTPFLTDLRDMLEERPFTESDGADAVALPSSGGAAAMEADDEGAAGGGLYTRSDLVAGTRASEREIDAALRSMGAAEIGGRVRIVETKLMAFTFDLTLSLIEEQGWDFGAVSVEACCSELNDSPRFAVERAIAMHGEPAPEGQTAIWALSAAKVATFVGLQLLRSPPAGADRWATLALLEAWKEKLPEALLTPSSGVVISTELLGGLAVLENPIDPLTLTASESTTIRLMPIARLSIDPETRFEQLFAIKARWSESELRPFVCELEGVARLLVKFTRTVTENGVRYHCPR